MEQDSTEIPPIKRGRGRPPLNRTDDEKKAMRNASNKNWRQNNKEKFNTCVNNYQTKQRAELKMAKKILAENGLTLDQTNTNDKDN